VQYSFMLRSNIGLHVSKSSTVYSGKEVVQDCMAPGVVVETGVQQLYMASTGIQIQ